MPGGTDRRKRLRAFAIALVASACAIAVAGPSGVAAPGDGAGSILTFGRNDFGQLGTTTSNGTTDANPVPESVTLPGATGVAAKVAAGEDHSLVVTSSGQLYAFGSNAWGQLGNSGTAAANPVPTLVALPGQVGSVTQVAAGDFFSLALTSSGQVYAFGVNLHGQLGTTDDTTPNPAPTLVTLPGAVGSVTHIGAGGFSSLVATASGQLYTFGLNNRGQLGYLTNSGTVNPNPTPALVTLPGQIGTIAELSGGSLYSLVLTSSGQLYGFGDNEFGQLGTVSNIGTTTANPTPALVTLPGQVGTIVHIAAGNDHSLVVTSSGQLYAFGKNNEGQLGSVTTSGTTIPSPTPAIVTLPGVVGPVTQIAAGFEHSLAATASGQLYAFGLNLYGELGVTADSSSVTPHPTPTPIAAPAGTTIDAVAAGPGGLHSVALVSNLAIVTDALPVAQVGSSYHATLQAAGGTTPLTWSVSGLPAGLVFDPASASITGTPVTAVTASLTVVLTDAYGSSVTHTLPLLTAAAPAPPVSVEAPKLSALKQSVRRWVLGTKLSRLVASVPATVRRGGMPVGTTFSFRLDQSAQVTLTFRHATQGRRVAGKCVVRTRSNAAKPHCTRTLTDGTIRVNAAGGNSRLRFDGRVNSMKKLTSRSYSVAVSAKNAAGKTSTAQVLHFTIAPG